MKKIKSNGITVTVTQWIDDEHQDSYWYDGTCAYFKYGDWVISVVANGEVELYGDYEPENDTELIDGLESGELEFEHNNWWEMFIDIDGEEYTSDVLGSVFLTDAIDEATANFYGYIED